MDTENKTITTTEDTVEAPYVVKFSKPYHFEGQDYTEIDLSGLEELTAKDMLIAEKWASKKGIVSPIPETTYEYVALMAHRASEQPIEFFKRLPPKDALKVKNVVTGFFYGED